MAHTNKLEVISSVEQAVEYQKAWVNAIQLEPGYHQAVKDRFGDDLSEIFGPRDMRKKVKTLSNPERQAIYKAVKHAKKVPGVERGRLVSNQSEIISLPALQIRVFDAFRKILNPLTGKPVLYGLQLDHGDIAEAFASGQPTDIGLMYILTDVQRPIDLNRQIRYMLGNFDPALFTGVIGRLDLERGGIIVDDGQQGTVLTTAHGFKTIGVNFSVRQGPAEDARLLLVSNTYKLPMTPFEIFRNQVIVAEDDAMRKGIGNIKPEDFAAYNLNRIVTEPGTEIQFKFEGTGISAGQCNTVKQILKLFKQYAESDYLKAFAFKQAIKTVKLAWPSKPITSEGIWALSELFTQFQSQKIKVDDVMIHRIADILSKEFVSANTMWSNAKNIRDKNYPKSDDANNRYHGEGVKGPLMASMIVELIYNHLEMQRSQPGAPTVKQLQLPVIVDADGKTVVISKGATDPSGKEFIRVMDGQMRKTMSILAGTPKDEVDSFLEETVSA